jgi:hypothetical protein
MTASIYGNPQPRHWTTNTIENDDAAALQARRTGLLSQLIRRTRDHQELPNGHRFVFDATEDMVPTVARVIDAERQCCRFLRFN